MKYFKIIYFALVFFSSNIYAWPHLDDNVNTMINQAKTHMYQNPVEAIKYADSADEKAEELNDTSLIFETKVLLGSAYSMNGNYDLALETYLNAENYLDTLNQLRVADYNIYMASMYFSLNNTKKAHRYNDLAYNTFREKNDTTGLGWCLNLRGLIFIQEERFSRAQSALELSLIFHESTNDSEAVYTVINNMALLPGDEKQKIIKLKDAIGYNEKNKNDWSLAENYNNLGLLYTRSNDLENAKFYLAKAMILADSLNANILKRDNLMHRSKIAVQEKKFELAYDNFLRISEIDKEINSIDKIHQIEDQASERKRLIHIHNLEMKDLELQTAKNEKITLLILGLALLIITLLTIRVYHLRRVNKLILQAEYESHKKDELSKVLVEKDNEIHTKNEILNISKKEMTDLVYFIKSKDKLLDNIIDLLKEALKKQGDESKVKIKSTVALIKNFREKELKTELFINEINKNEEEFLERLKIKHPDLSKNEIILTTLLRIGLSSKEIALLVDSNPKTVNMARYRLRKKLNLETDENLVNYFEIL
ncbi:MAG: tetratricopeptide repeat protein [Bacteroidales bacterium]